MEFNQHEVVYGDVIIRLRPRSLLSQEIYNRFVNEWLDFAHQVRLALDPIPSELEDETSEPTQIASVYKEPVAKVQALMDSQSIDFEMVEYIAFYLILLSPRILSTLECPVEFWRQVDTLSVKIDKLEAFMLSKTIELLNQIDSAIQEMDKPADKVLASENGLTEDEKKSAPKSKRRSTTG